MPEAADEHDLARGGDGKGFLRNWESDTMVVSITDAEFLIPRRLSLAVLEDTLLLRASCSGDCRYAVDGGRTWQYQTAAVTVDAIPAGMRLDVGVAANVLQQSITVLIRPQSLLALVGEALQEPLRRLLESPMDGARQLLNMPMSAELLSLLHDLRHSRLPAKMRCMQMGVRATELVMLTMAGWSARFEDRQSTGLLKRDAELLAAARRALLERCAQPPTLESLAKELGTNKNKLTQLFRERFGTSLQGYALDRRMERARELIADGRMTLGQVADAVGYQHQSSFTTAFRQFTGMSPSEYASRAALCSAH